MNSCICTSSSLTFFWTAFFVGILQHDCFTMQPVDICPRNAFEVGAATLRLNCSDIKKSINVYHCLPLSNLSMLVEFCYDGLSGLIEAGNCMVLENQHLNNFPCNRFTKGCPIAPYFSKHMYRFPSCVRINKQNRCYLADPTCPFITSSVEKTTIPTLEVIRNNNVQVHGTTMPTEPTKENNNPTTDLNHALLTVAIVATVTTVGLIGLFITMKMKHRKCTKERKAHQGNHTLPEEKYLLKQDKKGIRFDIYNCDGVGIRFIRLQECLINNISEEELVRLKEYLKRLVPVNSLNEESLEKADSVQKFLDFLILEGIFTDRDVIIMQHLMRKMEKPELDQECVDYATKRNDRVCYFKEEETAADGSSRVELHVVDNIEKFTTLDSLIETVAAIVNCDRQSIDVIGIHPDSSFIIVMEMEKKVAQSLLRKTPQELMKFVEFKIDRINIDGEDITISVPGNKEKNEDPKIDSSRYIEETGDKKKTEDQPEMKEFNEKSLGAQRSYASQVKYVLSSECANLFRKLLRKYVLEEDLMSKIQREEETLSSFLSVNQHNVLYPKGGRFCGNYKSLDLPLMYILFQKVSFIKIQPHKKGWGNSPDPSDTSLAANIERIMEIHKDYSGDAPLFLNQSDFDRIVKRIVHLSENIEDILKGRREDSYEEQSEKQHRLEIEGPLEKEEMFKEKLKDESLSYRSIPRVVEKFSITVPSIDSVNHISFVASDRLWVSDYKNILQVNYAGYRMQKKKRVIGIPLSGNHSVTEAGDLLFIDDDKVQKITSGGKISPLIQVRHGELFCIHYSCINGNLLVGKRGEVMRFDRIGQRINAYTMQLGKMSYPLYIAENRNGDIWVSANDPDISDEGAVVVLDRSGQYRFDYSQSDFNPRGICIDILGRALVCDDNYICPCIHLLDQDGHFLDLLLAGEYGLHHPTALCLDNKNNLYLGQCGSNKVMVYDYLHETDVSVSLYLSPTSPITLITVSMIHGIFHISCGTSDRFWVNDHRHLLQVDTSGHEKLLKKVEFHEEGGVHTVTTDGNLLFIDHDKVQKMTADGIITTLMKIDKKILLCVYSSRINGDIFLGCHCGWLRYDERGKNGRYFSMDRKHRECYPMYITENMNGDIWISDCVEKAVKVYDNSGQHRFNYTGQPYFAYRNFYFEHQRTFVPHGICSNILGQVLVCDISDPSVHLLDQDGQFLRLLLTIEDGLHRPTALCVDNKHNVYVGQEYSNRITVYKFLHETEDFKTSMVESK